jgi:uncharacterized repeat protein (TIGR01451 family)
LKKVVLSYCSVSLSRISALLFLMLISVVGFAAEPAVKASVAAATKSQSTPTLRSMPVLFEENRGQAPGDVRFFSRGAGYTVALKPSESVIRLQKSSRRDAAASELRTTLLGVDRAATLVGKVGAKARVSYLKGSDQSKWITGVPTYSIVQYHGVYSGIDLNYYGQDASIEYDFVVRPGADPRQIAMQLNGAKRITRQSNGDLRVELENGEVTVQKPVAYQDFADGRHKVDSQFIISDNNHLRFDLGAFDARRPLVIDPTISYATFIGSVSLSVTSIAVDSARNLFFVALANEGGLALNSNGSACIDDLQNPCTANPGAVTPFSDIAAGELDANGTLLWLSYVGGSLDDSPRGSALAIDTVGTPGIVFGGRTFSSDYPVTNPALSGTCGNCNAANDTSAGFLTKLTLDGQNLVYSTYIGGSNGSTTVNAATSMSDGTLAVTGETTATDLPTSLDAEQSVRRGGSDGFVMKFAPAIVQAKPSYLLGYSSLYGGAALDAGTAITAVNNDLWVGANTNSSDINQTGFEVSQVFPGGFWTVQPNIPNGGAFWNNFFTFLQNRNMTALSLDPVTGKIFASLKDGGSLAVSADDGFSWTTHGFQGLTPGHVATSVQRFGPGQFGAPNYYIAVPRLGVFRSIDGSSWFNANGTIAAPYNVKEVSADPFSENFLIAFGPSTLNGSTPVAGVAYRGVTSISGTPAWSAMNFNGVVSTNVDLAAVSWDQRVGGLVWAYVKGGSAPTGLYKSNDHGQNWAFVSATPVAKNLWTGVLDPTTLLPTVFIVDSNDKLEYGINGANFSIINVGSNTAPVTAFASTRAFGGQTYFVGTKYGNVWQSSDLVTWVAASPANAFSLKNQWVQDLAIKPEPDANLTFLMAAMSEPQMGFVMHLSPTNQIVNGQYFTGSKDTYVSSISANAANVAIAGTTMANDLPANVYGNYPFITGQTWNSYASLITLGGTAVTWTQYMGTGLSSPAIAVDQWGTVAVTGSTLTAMNQAAFATNSAEINISTPPDAFYFKTFPNGTTNYFTYLRGSGSESGNTVAIDSDDNVYIGGSTGSSDFMNTITVAGGLSTPTYSAGNFGGFLLKANMQGAADVTVTQQVVVQPANVVPGATITGSFTLNNIGPGTATNPHLAVTAPINTVLSAFAFTGTAIPQCTQQITPTDWICTIPSLAPGASVTFPYTATAAALGGFDYFYSTISTLEVNRNTSPTLLSPISVSTTAFDLAVNLAPPTASAGSATPLVFTVTDNSSSTNVHASLQVTVDPSWFVDPLVTINDPLSANHLNSCSPTAKPNVQVCFFDIDSGSPITFTFSVTPTLSGTYPIQFDLENLTGADPDMSNNIGSTNVTVGAGAAPVGGSRGTDFWIVFPPNGDLTVTNLELTLESSGVANGTINSIDGTVNQQFSLNGNATSITVPAQLMQGTIGSAENKGIHVTSDTPISVYAMSLGNAKSDAFLAIPTATLGADYFTAHIDAQQNDSSVGTSQISVVATQDATQVTIAPTATLTNAPPTVVSLNAGQTYYVESAGDLSNTHVTATKPIAVLSGNKCARINLGSATPTACNFLVEELMPTNLWGKTFATPDGLGRLQGYLLKVIGPLGTVVTAETDAANPRTIGAQGFVELPRSFVPQQISTSNPSEVMLFTEGRTSGDTQANATMMTLPPMETWTTNQDFGNPTTSNFFGTNAVLVGPAGFQYPDPPLAPVFGNGYTFGNTQYGPTMTSQTYAGYTATAHTVTTPAPAVSYVYLDDPSQTFATPAGFGPFVSLVSAQLQLTNVAGQTTSTVTADTNACLLATATLTGGAGAPVSFSLSGLPNTNFYGTAVLEQADGNGIASTTADSTFCLSSNKGGTSTLFASSGKNISAPVQVNWRAVADLGVFPNFAFSNSAPNATLPFTVEFQNFDTTSVQNVTITVTSSTGAAITWVPSTFISETGVSYTCSGPGTTVVCSIPFMQGFAFDGINFQMNAGVTSGTLTATITSSDPTWFDPFTGNNSGSFNYNVGGTEDLYVNYVSPGANQIAGTPYQYQLVVGNAGPANLFFTWNLTENLPAYTGTVTATAQTGTCSVSGQSLSCSGTTLNAGATETITVTITPAQSGTLYHSAHVEDYLSYAINESNLANNDASMAVTVGPTGTAAEALLIYERGKDSISIYNKQGNLLLQLPPSAPAVSQIAMSPNGRTLFVSYATAPFISVYDIQLAKEIHRIQGVRSDAIGVTLDGKQLVVGSLDSDDVLFFDAASFAQLYDVDVNGLAGDSAAPNDLFMHGMLVSSKTVFIGSSGTGRVLEIALSSVSSSPQVYTSFTGGILGSSFNNQFAITQDEQLLAVSGQPAGFTFPPFYGSFGSVVNAGSNCGVATNRTADVNHEYMYACSGTSLKQFSFGNSQGTEVNSITVPFNPSDVVADGTNLYVIGRQGGFAAYNATTLASVTLPFNPTLDHPRAIKNVIIDRTTPAANLPVISGVSPQSVADGQSNLITITGSNFASDAMVRIGSQDLPVTFVSSTQLQVTLPDNSPAGNNFDVIVVNPTVNSLQGSDSAAILPNAISVTNSASFATNDHLLTSSLSGGVITDYLYGRIGDRKTGPEVADFLVSPDGGLLYGPSSFANNVTVTDFVQGIVVNTFSFANGPGFYVGSAQTIDPANARRVLLTMNTTADPTTGEPQDALTVIDIEPASPNFNQVIKTIPANSHDISRLGAIAAKPDGTAAYVSVLGTDKTPRVLIFDLANQVATTINMGSLIANPSPEELPYIYVTPDSHYLFMTEGDRTVLNIMNIAGAKALAPATANRINIIGSLGSTRPKGTHVSAAAPFSPGAGSFYFDRFIVDQANGLIYAMDHSHEPPQVGQIAWDPATGLTGGSNQLALANAHGSWLGAGLALSADGSRLYAVQQTDDAVSIINTGIPVGAQGFAEIGRFATSIFPSGVAISSALAPAVNLTAQFQQTTVTGLAGSPVSADVLVTNIGTSTATNVNLAFTLPAGLHYVSSPAACTAVAQTVTCGIGSIAAAGSQSVQIVVSSSVIGQQQLSATASSTEADANPADNTTTVFVASTGCTTPAGFTKTWVGGDATSPSGWDTVTNWSPAGVPAASDNVYICAGAVTQPALQSPATVNNILMETGTVSRTRPAETHGKLSQPNPATGYSLTLGSFNLTVKGSYNGTALGTGYVVFSGAGNTAEGYADNAIVSAPASLSSDFGVGNTLNITGGTLTIGAHTLIVGQSLLTASTGALDLSNSIGVINAKDVSLAGGASNVTNGTMAVTGNFTVNGGAFPASGANIVILNGSAVQSIAFANNTASHFANLTVVNPSTILLGTPVTVTNNTTFNVLTTQLLAASALDTFATNGIDVHALLTTAPLVINGSPGSVDASNIHFGAIVDGVNELTVNNTAGTYTFDGFIFDSLLTTGNYVAANGAIIVNMTNPSLPQPTPNSVVTGGAVVNWPTSPTPVLLTAVFNSANVPGAAVLATGSGYLPTSVVQWDGVTVPTTYLSPTQLQASVPADLLTSGGHAVTVFTSGGGSSAIVILQLSAGSYQISALNPQATIAGGPSFPIQISGAGFSNGSSVLWNGSARTTTFVSSTQLTATISAADIAQSGTAMIAVKGKTGYSNAVAFAITKIAAPTLTDFLPANASAGTNGASLTVNGANFTTTSVVMVNGTSRVTAYVSATRLNAQLTASDVANSGSIKVAVKDTASGLSAAADYSVADFLTSLDATSIAVTKSATGTAKLTLTPKLGSYDAAVTFSCSGLPAEVACSFSPNSIAPGQNPTTVQVAIGFIKTSKTRQQRPLLIAMLSVGFFGILLVGGTRRKWLRVVLLASTLALIALSQVGCGGGGGSLMQNTPPPNTGGTSSTTNYNVNITATSGSVSHNSAVTVTITN